MLCIYDPNINITIVIIFLGMNCVPKYDKDSYFSIIILGYGDLVDNISFLFLSNRQELNLMVEGKYIWLSYSCYYIE